MLLSTLAAVVSIVSAAIALPYNLAKLVRLVRRWLKKARPASADARTGSPDVAAATGEPAA